MPPLYLIYWVLVIVAFVFGGIRNKDTFGTWAEGNLLYLILFIILGLEVFAKSAK